MTPCGVDPLDRPAFRRLLLEWYGAHRRELPWRREGEPYAIWVAEVMLQQTRVETVIPYYRRWMERFPDVKTLAAAPEEEVLRLWQGLGYYSRARNLHRAASRVVEEHGGRLPADPRSLRELPGVGEYTAGAVASIAFDRAAPAVDGNVRRVLARLGDDPEPTPARLREWAGGLVDPERPGDFNQALMELGSRVCTPGAPSCGECPVASFCAARERGTQHERPTPARKAKVRAMDVAVAAVILRPLDEGGDLLPRLVLRRRPSEGLLGGMWELPGQEVEGPESASECAHRLARDVISALAAAGWAPAGEAPLRLPEPVRLEPVSHAFSHRRARYHPFVFRMETAPAAEEHPGGPARGREEGRDGWGKASAGDLRILAPAELGGIPLPVAQRKVLRAVGDPFRPE